MVYYTYYLGSTQRVEVRFDAVERVSLPAQNCKPGHTKPILIISNKVTDTKYSLSNDGSLVDSQKENLAFRQAQRYWVERNFDDGKNELGMSDYQIRKWKSWHHHHAIVLMAMLFMLREQIDQEVHYPIISLHDARKMAIVLIAQTIIEAQNPVEQEVERMEKKQGLAF
ncbi:MAG: hypothetical protein ACI81T_000816 [Bacteroidia bacterium]